MESESQSNPKGDSSCEFKTEKWLQQISGIIVAKMSTRTQCYAESLSSQHSGRELEVDNNTYR